MESARLLGFGGSGAEAYIAQEVRGPMMWVWILRVPILRKVRTRRRLILGVGLSSGSASDLALDCSVPMTGYLGSGCLMRVTVLLTSDRTRIRPMSWGQ